MCGLALIQMPKRSKNGRVRLITIIVAINSTTRDKAYGSFHAVVLFVVDVAGFSCAHNTFASRSISHELSREKQQQRLKKYEIQTDCRDTWNDTKWCGELCREKSAAKQMSLTQSAFLSESCVSSNVCSNVRFNYLFQEPG